MKIEARQLFRLNGLIDELIVYGKPDDYLQFAEAVGKAITSNVPMLFLRGQPFSIEIVCDESDIELITSLQNEANEYFSIEDWNNRNILRVRGNKQVLSCLQTFLTDLASKGIGYSYISEFSQSYTYFTFSPEWRLHIENG